MTDQDYEDRVRDTVNAFCTDIARLSEEQAKTWPNGDRLVGLAKSLCCAASPYMRDEEDANRLTLGIAGGQITHDVKRTAALQMPIRPAWWHFLSEAAIAVKYLGADVPQDKAVDFMKAVREIARP